MENAAFKIVKYKFDKVNIDLSNFISENILLSFTTRGIFKPKQSEYELIFIIEAYNDDNKHKPFLMVQCIGNFSFEQVNTIEEIPDFFYKNCIAILFPYLRAYISIITSQANIPGIMLPTLNLSSLENELRINTTIQN